MIKKKGIKKTTKVSKVLGALKTTLKKAKAKKIKTKQPLIKRIVSKAKSLAGKAINTAKKIEKSVVRAITPKKKTATKRKTITKAKKATKTKKIVATKTKKIKKTTAKRTTKVTKAKKSSITSKKKNSVSSWFSKIFKPKSK